MAVPFTAFNFAVEIDVPEVADQVCSAAFSECDGLELTMEARSIREGGNNTTQIRLAGPVSYGQVTLRRGMTASLDLWRWFARVTADPALRADGIVVLRADDGDTVRATWLLERCLPVRLRAPSLNAREGMVAIEELQLVCDAILLQAPGGEPLA